MLHEVIKKSRAYYCVECRKCSSICPVTRVYGKFSPASIVERSLVGIDDEVLESNEVWKCLSCGLCHEVCPSGVDFLSFTREVRMLARERGNTGIPTHEGVFESIEHLMAEGEVAPPSLEHGKTDEDADTLYFAGCLPFFDTMFREVGFNGMKIADDVVRLLNHYGITPAVHYGCCGHDALWNGDMKLFEKLRKKNVAMVKERGVKKIIFSCPECYRTFKMDYPEMNAELLHISEFLAEQKMEGEADDREYTYHDPCRLGRHLGIYDAPREVLGRIGVEVREMEHHHELAVCCGTAAWMSCDWKSEEIRKERLDEAEKTADILITACPKCQIHFKCTLSHEKRDLEVKDLVELVAERIL
ncbi:MAG: (Fe-S)-binding protein [Thermoplasmata archaeon]|nr:MAG: (Fe-S)-binding protein [Thermoplasmata archaeon]RLF33615.1 MAG: (Fe-S)-binding protein [Thermoplasmata archaeon]